MIQIIFKDHPDLLEILRQCDPPVYLVGGAVRDFLLNKTTHDLDFVLAGDAGKLARRIANQFGAAYFMLDDERNTARVFLDAVEQKTVLDFAQQRGNDLEKDLRDRDFTINAIAVDLKTLGLIDPLKGAVDLKDRYLRVCSENSFKNDPLRVLRAVRLSVAYQLKIVPETKRLLRDAIHALPRVSGERIRDELFRMLQANQSSKSMRILGKLGVIPIIFPELEPAFFNPTKAVGEKSVWENTLTAMHYLDIFFDLIVGNRNPQAGENMIAGLIVLALGPFRYRLQSHYQQSLNPDRGLKGLLSFSILLSRFAHFQNDGSTITARQANWGETIKEVCRSFALSSKEIKRLEMILKNQALLQNFSQVDILPGPKEIYRFFRSAQEAGIDLCLICLCEILAKSSIDSNQEYWGKQVELCRHLFAAWWDQHAVIIDPPALLNGDDLIHELALKSSPIIGAILEQIREAQAAGKIKLRSEALAYAREILDRT